MDCGYAGTLRPLPTEPVVIPPLCLSGRLPEQQNAQVNLDLSAAQPPLGGGAAADVTAWAEFHNGVAGGETAISHNHSAYPLKRSSGIRL